jgi:hypothetical protein
VPWSLGPPDGRYLLRKPTDPPQAPAAHVLVLATLGAVERRGLAARRKRSQAEPEPEPQAVMTGRATIVDVGSPLPDERAAQAWLAAAGEPDLEQGLEVLNRALHAFRLVTADPYVHAVARDQALVARVGFGAGEQVADGLWTDAHELTQPVGRRRRVRILAPQARLAAVLGGRERVLACQELTLRARLDLDHGLAREAALQLLVALDAALAELPTDDAGPALTDRLMELRERRDPVTQAAQAALAGPLGDSDREVVEQTLARIEAALRARAVALG